jgi:hypothetical protein
LEAELGGSEPLNSGTEAIFFLEMEIYKEIDKDIFYVYYNIYCIRVGFHGFQYGMAEGRYGLMV